VDYQTEIPGKILKDVPGGKQCESKFQEEPLQEG